MEAYLIKHKLLDPMQELGAHHVVCYKAKSGVV